MRLQGLVSVGVWMWFGLGGIAQAATLTITISNMTSGISFKELLVVAHGVKHPPFASGFAATAGLEALAECGDQSTLVTEVHDADPRANVWGVESYPNELAKLGPGATTLTIGPLLVTEAVNTRLSIAGRMMATNDGFAGLEAVPIPSAPGTYTFDLLAFDAGTEGNNELFKNAADTACSSDPNMADLLTDLPDDPFLGVNGTGASKETAGEALVFNTSITIHRGVLGDSYAGGGVSDLDFTHHRWTNPVATVTVIVQ